MKKLVLPLAMLSVLAMTACNQSNAPAAPSETKTSTPATDGATSSMAELTLTTVTGPQAIEANPHPLAVYDMTILQNLKALGVPVEATPELKDGLAQRLNLLTDGAPAPEVVGTFFEPDLEKLNAVQPKAVLIGSRMSEKESEIAQVAKVYNLTLPSEGVEAATKQQLTELGNIFGKQAEATKAIGDIEQAIGEAKAAVNGKGNGLVILINANKMSAYGKKSRFAFIHETFGVPEADSHIEESRHGQPISFEYIQKVDPDWLFVLDRGAAIGEEGTSAQTLLDNDLMKNTKAFKNNHIIYLSADSYMAFGGYYQWLNDAKTITEAFNATSATQ